MTAPRSTFLLLLVAACLALTAAPAFAEPVETPPAAPPAGAADELPEGPPPGAADEAVAEVVEVMKAAPGRMPNTDGPKIPRVVGRLPHEANQALSAWRVRNEHVVTNRSFVGRIVDQHPDAGSTLAPGEVITLVVGIPTLPSRGYTCVPPIEKLTLEAGAAALRKQGFDIMLRVVESYDRDKGVVLAQAPRPASVAPRGSKVIVLVGKGGLADPVPAIEPVEPLPAPTPDIVTDSPAPVPPAGATSMPAGPPPGAEPPVVVEPPMPPAEEPPTPAVPTPPAEEPPTPAMPTPPAEEPPTPAMPTPPAEEPPTPMPPAEEPTPPAPMVEEPPAPIPVEAPKPKVMLRVPTLAGPANGSSFPEAFGSTFMWAKVNGAKTYEWELQVEAKDGSWSTVSTETVEGTNYRPKRMEAGRLRWRVRAMADGVEGEWSEFRRLFLY